MIEIYYDKDVKQHKTEPEFFCAKYRQTDKKNEAFFIVFDENGFPLNPLGSSYTRQKTKERYKLKTVEKELFELYLQFLTTKNTVLYNKLRRFITSTI